MYGWIYWRHTRIRFFGLLISATIVLSLSIIPSVLVNKSNRLILIRGGSPSRVAKVWRSATGGPLLEWGTFITAAVGLVLGATGVADEYRKGTLWFLLTRPRRKDYYVWRSFAVGIAEILVVNLVAVAAAFFTLTYLTESVYTWRFWAEVPLMTTAAAVLYAQTYFLSVLTKSTTNGLSCSLGVFIVEILAPGIIEHFWQWHMPSMLALVASPRWLNGQTQHFPFIPLLSGFILTATFAATSAYVFSRTEL